MTGIELIAAERKRQIEEEGFTAEHDDKYDDDELTKAAICYAMYPEECKLWPWDLSWWNPASDNRVNDLKKAGALIAAEIDRLLRLEAQDGKADD